MVLGYRGPIQSFFFYCSKSFFRFCTRCCNNCVAMAATFCMAAFQAALPSVQSTSGRVSWRSGSARVSCAVRTRKGLRGVALQAFSGLRTDNPLQLRTGELHIPIFHSSFWVFDFLAIWFVGFCLVLCTPVCEDREELQGAELSSCAFEEHRRETQASPPGNYFLKFFGDQNWLRRKRFCDQVLQTHNFHNYYSKSNLTNGILD